MSQIIKIGISEGHCFVVLDDNNCYTVVSQMGSLVFKEAETLLSIVGSSRHTVLRGSLCVHHIRRLWSLLWRCLHAHSSSYYHSCGNAAFYYWADWMLCHNSRKPLWTRYGKLQSCCVVVLPCCVSGLCPFNRFSKCMFFEYFLLSCLIAWNLVSFVPNILCWISVLNNSVSLPVQAAAESLCFTF